MSAAKILALALAVLYAAAVFQPVIARDRNTFGVPDIMVEERWQAGQREEKRRRTKGASAQQQLRSFTDSATQRACQGCSGVARRLHAAADHQLGRPRDECHPFLSVAEGYRQQSHG